MNSAHVTVGIPSALNTALLCSCTYLLLAHSNTHVTPLLTAQMRECLILPLIVCVLSVITGLTSYGLNGNVVPTGCRLPVWLSSPAP